jgi:hypothetical protein
VTFRVVKMRRVHVSALKHGIARLDIAHALRHALRAIDEDDGSRLYLGAARDGTMLEVVAIPQPDGSVIAVHAMKMRMKYASLLPRE